MQFYEQELRTLVSESFSFDLYRAFRGIIVWLVFMQLHLVDMPNSDVKQANCRHTFDQKVTYRASE